MALNSPRASTSRARSARRSAALLLAAFGAARHLWRDVASYAVVDRRAAVVAPARRRRTTACARRLRGAMSAPGCAMRAAQPRACMRVLLRAAVFFALGERDLGAAAAGGARSMLGGGAGLLRPAARRGRRRRGRAARWCCRWLRARLDADGLMLAGALAIAGAHGGARAGAAALAAAVPMLRAGGRGLDRRADRRSTPPHRRCCRTGCADAASRVYLTVFYGAMTVGSLGWGLVGEAIGVPARWSSRRPGWCASGASPLSRLRAAGRRGRPRRLEPLAGAAGGRPVATSTAGRCWCQIEYRVGPSEQRGLPRGPDAPLGRAPPRRRLCLGGQRGRRRPGRRGRMVPGRVLGRTLAPAPARVACRRRCGTRSPAISLSESGPAVRHLVGLGKIASLP